MHLRELTALYDYQISYLGAFLLYLLANPNVDNQEEMVKEISKLIQQRRDARKTGDFTETYKRSMEFTGAIRSIAEDYGLDAENLTLYLAIYASLTAQRKRIVSVSGPRDQIKTPIQSPQGALVYLTEEPLPAQQRRPEEIIEGEPKLSFWSLLEQHGHVFKYAVDQLSALRISFDEEELAKYREQSKQTSFWSENQDLLLPTPVKNIHGINNFWAFYLRDSKDKIIHESFRCGLPVPHDIKKDEDRKNATLRNLTDLATAVAQKLYKDGRLSGKSSEVTILLQNLSISNSSLSSLIQEIPYVGPALHITLMAILPFTGIILAALNPLFIFLMLPAVIIALFSILPRNIKGKILPRIGTEISSSLELEDALKELENNPKKISIILPNGNHIKPHFLYTRHPLTRFTRKTHWLSEKPRHFMQMGTELIELIRARKEGGKDFTKEEEFFYKATINQYSQLMQPAYLEPDWRNLMAAAYENIISESLGIAVVDFCRSGKDRTGVELICISALRQYYAEYGSFPNLADTEQRKDFAKIFASIFLSDHFQNNPDLNAPGALGLKNLGGIIPRFLQVAITDEAHRRVAVAKESENSVKLLLSLSKTDEKNLVEAGGKTDEKNLDQSEVSPTIQRRYSLQGHATTIVTNMEGRAQTALTRAEYVVRARKKHHEQKLSQLNKLPAEVPLEEIPKIAPELDDLLPERLISGESQLPRPTLKPIRRSGKIVPSDVELEPLLSEEKEKSSTPTRDG